MPDSKYPMRDFSRLHWGAFILLGLAAIMVVILIAVHSISVASERNARRQTLAVGPQVAVVTAASGAHNHTVTLFADVTPYLEATLYGKVSGYLKRVIVDKGDAVKAGQRVAEIASVETDAQYASAVADLQNKRVVAVEDEALLKEKAIASQTESEAVAAERMAEATVNQLATLKSYEILTAPFDGTVTARYADPGALVQNAENSQTGSLPVVRISDQRRLRIDAYVQQADAPFVREGMPVAIADATNPERKIMAAITRTSGELDPQSRTMLIEAEVDNSGFLIGGSFAYVTLQLATISYPEVPVDAVMTRHGQSMVAVTDSHGIVHFRAVVIASNDGASVRIASGLRAGEHVALDVPDEVTDGSHVQAIFQRP